MHFLVRTLGNCSLRCSTACIHAVVALLGCLWPFHLFAAHFPALVDDAWLSQNSSQVVVLDVRSRTEFMHGHWPDARWAGFNALDWQVNRQGVPGYLPTEKELSELLGSFGLTGSESVVVMGSAGQPRQVAEATRVIWSLMTAGFRQVALLDGGIESLPAHDLVKGMPPIHSTVCSIEFQHDLLADTNRVEGLLDDNGAVVDFRPTPYFEGVKRDPRLSKPGTILDALGYPPERLFDVDGNRLLRPERLKQEFERYSIPTDGPVATFSDTGVWAALGWFVLHRIVSNPHARLYDGSLAEWIDWGGEVHDSTDDMGGPIG
jgi:thiosulfate/3-mercaptopyruvate sulfurtransferase